MTRFVLSKHQISFLTCQSNSSFIKNTKDFFLSVDQNSGRTPRNRYYRILKVWRRPDTGLVWISKKIKAEFCSNQFRSSASQNTCISPRVFSSPFLISVLFQLEFHSLSFFFQTKSVLNGFKPHPLNKIF